MLSKEFVKIAESFACQNTCYLKGFWGQQLTKVEYDRVLKMYPGNASYGNTGKIGTNVFAFDCICFVKAILGGCATDKRISYAAMAANPIGDCTNTSFLAKLQNGVHCDPKDAPAGYGLATTKHAAISLGDGRWIDCNFGSGQNGIAIHNSGIEQFTVAGQIPGVDYSDLTESSNAPMSDEKASLMAFCESLVDAYLMNK